MGEGDLPVEPDQGAAQPEERRPLPGTGPHPFRPQPVDQDGSQSGAGDAEGDQSRLRVPENPAADPPQPHVEWVARDVRLAPGHIEVVQGQGEIDRVPVIEPSASQRPSGQNR